MKKIVIASDHGGLALKLDLVQRLEQAGYEVTDILGGADREHVDYPDVVVPACKLIQNNTVDCGILICGTGLGVGIVANKMKGIRAVTCSETFSARMGKEHNDANVLTLGARVTGNELAWEVVLAYLQAEFHGGRHQVRIEKIEKMEE